MSMCDHDRRRWHRQLADLLVLTHFFGPCPLGMECCHYDGNPANNDYANLRWDTHTANEADKERHGRTPCGDRSGARLHPERLARGERVRGAVLTEEAVRQIRRRYRLGCRRDGARALAREFGVCRRQISRVVRGDTWRHVP